MADDISVKLELDSALVLFEWLCRFNESENTSFEDKAEELVLWEIEAILEKRLVEPFKSNYDELLKDARNRIKSRYDDED